VSTDSIEKNELFRDTESLSYSLVSDAAALATELGIVRDVPTLGLVAARVTFLLEPEGRILGRWDVTPEELDSHPDAVLDFLRSLS
jgi:Peroxiredoxin